MTLQDVWMYLGKENLKLQTNKGEQIERYNNHLYINSAVEKISSQGNSILVTIK